MENLTGIIILAVFLLLWCLDMLRNHRYIIIQKMVEADTGKDTDCISLPTMSIIVPTYEQCNALRQNLPPLLEQEYPQDFEVIVVDMNSTDETRMYLESLEGRYPHLHVTQMPDTARSVSPIRLALTLGIRAASGEWVVLTQANCHPASEQWLMRLGKTCTEKKEFQIVMGYTRFIKGQGWNGLRCRFFRLWQQMLHLPFAIRHSAYRNEGTNLCYRRSYFLTHRGFAEHSNLLLGATDIMVNHHSTRLNTTVCLHQDAQMLQECPPYSKWWRQERLFFMETRHHFSHWVLYRLKYASHILLTEIFTLSAIVVIATESLLFHNYIMTAVAALLWIIHAVCRSIWFNRSARALGERPIQYALPLLLHLVPWWDTIAWFRWLFTKKKMFQKKYI